MLADADGFHLWQRNLETDEVTGNALRVKINC